MELINKNNAVIQNKTQALRKSEPRISFLLCKRRIRFTQSVAKQFHLVKGSYVHFMVDAGRIYFFNNDDKTGFKLKQESCGGMNIYSTPLVDMLMDKFKGVISVGNSFEVKKLLSKINDEQMFEVLLSTKKISRHKYSSQRESYHRNKLKTA